ncbi:MAG: hypothetical protein CSB55_03675 [Candidatus Cloacimonadota bacterium]|nr:MAG: hypothetical protein CSB55_03675 [Candidatus Cloacimonadota bacterium]
MQRKYSVIILFVLLFFTALKAELTQEELKRTYSENRKFNISIAEEIKKFIKENPDSEELPKLYYSLAELTSDIYAQEIMSNYKYNFEIANLYKKAISLNPNYETADVAYYNIGYYTFQGFKVKRDQGRNAQFDKGNYFMASDWPDSLRLMKKAVNEAIESLEKVSSDYPESDYRSATLYWLGNIYFKLAIDAPGDKETLYKKAIQYFTDLTKEKAYSERINGLYMRGWTFYALKDYDGAINDFSQILKELEQSSNKELKNQFETETIEMTAQGLVGKDDIEYEKYSKAAAAALETFSALVDENYGKQIINETINLKLQLNAPMQALDLYNAYLKLYPISIEAPSYNDSIISILKRSKGRTRNNKDVRKLIRKEYMRIADTYRPDSLWYQTFKDENIESQLKLIREAYEKYASVSLYNDFVKTGNEDLLRELTQLLKDYEKFKEFYDDNGKAWLENQENILVNAFINSAQKNKSVPLWFNALQEIAEYNEKYPNNKNYFNNEFNAFLCTENIYELVREDIEAINSGDSLRKPAMSEQEADSLYLTAADRYEKILTDETYTAKNKKDDLVKITYKRAEIYFKYADYDSSYQLFENLLALTPGENIQKVALTKLAEISKIRKNYLVAEDFYRRAGEFANTREKNLYKTNAMAMIKANADSLEIAGSNHLAAEEYLRLAKEYTDQEKIIPLKVKAVNNYKNRSEYDKAIEQILEIAQMKPQKTDKLGLYRQAWDIADSLMTEYKKGEELRKEFISLYPASNEAFKIRSQIIKSYDGGIFDDKDKAAEMYLQLHKDVREKKIDNGDFPEEQIYLLALNIYLNQEKEEQETKENSDKKELAEEENQTKDSKENLTVPMMLEFEKMYPKHEKSLAFLKKVALGYKKKNNTAKYKKMAAYIYKKHPELDLVSTIAIEELAEIYAEADTLYETKDYIGMREKIKEYKALEASYVAEKINKEKIHNNVVYENFDIWEENIKYEKDKVAYMEKYNSTLEKVEREFLEVSYNSIFKVNNLTKIKQHYVKRIKALNNQPDKYGKMLLELIKEGNKFEITTEQITRALFLRAECYKYTAEALTAQAQKFAEISTEIKQVEKISIIKAKNLKKQCLNMAAQKKKQLDKAWLQGIATIYKKFMKDKDYEDEWTLAAKNILIEKGILKDEISLTYDYYGKIFINNQKPNQSLSKTLKTDSLWSNLPTRETLSDNNSLKIKEIDTDYISFVNIKIIPETIPYKIEVDYYAKEEKNFLFNGMPADRQVSVKENLTIDSLSLTHYKFSLIKDFLPENDLSFIFRRDTTTVEKDLFDCNISIVYIREKLEEHRVTRKMHLNTDKSWMVKLNEEINPDTIIEIDSSWTLADTADFSVFKSSFIGMENSPAEVIWHSQEDTSSVDTIWLIKNIYIPEKFVSGEMKFIGQKELSAWINGTPIIENYKTEYDATLIKWLPKVIKPNPSLFRKGENQILFKVKDDRVYGGFIMEFDYTEKKKQENQEINKSVQDNQNSAIKNQNEENDKEEEKSNSGNE